MRSLNVIGISAGYHDAACALLQDGVLTAAVQEERFSRIKNDARWPVHAFRYCLESANLTIADVDCVAYYEDPCEKAGRQLWMYLESDRSPARRAATLDRLAGSLPSEVIARRLGFDGRVEYVPHHLSHAASSYYFSGFDEAAILTLDGVGEWATTLYAAGAGGRITAFEDVRFPHSLGLFYSAITAYLGFDVNEDEYKVMGLAAYGTPRYSEQMRQLIASCEDGQFRLDMDYFGFVAGEQMYSPRLEQLLGRPARASAAALDTFHEDVASSAQLILEEILLEKLEYLHGRCPSENLCLAGGVAHNVVAIGRCRREGPFKRIFIQPAAGDAGGSVGAAAEAHARIAGEPPRRARLEHVYLGPSADAEEIAQILSASSASYVDYRGRFAELAEATAAALAQGMVVGWVSGRLEFGPRALGARSILADPRRPEMRDHINALVKGREAFRPFAPAVLASHAQTLFEIDGESPFMQTTCRVAASAGLPAVTHVDGTARVQTVTADSHPRFAALLDAFYRQTGCPALLNTSFNVRGEPLVCSALDAIACFVNASIDLLVLEDFVVHRAELPPVWEMFARQRGRGLQDRPAIQHRVYTFL